MIHVAKTNVGGVGSTIIGDRVTVGHNAILHACTVKDDAFVGMGATVMDGAVVESGAMVAAGALVTPGTVVPTGQLWAGAPAKFMREMTAEEKAFTVTSAETYAEVGAVHAAENDKSFEELEYDKAARRMARSGIRTMIPTSASSARRSRSRSEPLLTLGFVWNAPIDPTTIGRFVRILSALRRGCTLCCRTLP